MRKLIFLLVWFQLYAFNLSAGCEPRLDIYNLSSNQFVGSVKQDGQSYSFTLNPTDSIRLTSFSNQGAIGSCVMNITSIYFNDSLIFSQNNLYSKTFTLVCKPGEYKVNAYVGYYFKIINSLAVGINEYQQELSNINLFPNPAHETVNISSEEPLKNVRLYNSNAFLLKEFEPNASVFSFPINELPNGVYFIFITTSDNKKAVRKFAVR